MFDLLLLFFSFEPGRKQKTPKKFTGEQPSISGTFGLKGMNKVEEKLKAGRMKRAEGALFTEESQRKQSVQAPTRKEAAVISSVDCFKGKNTKFAVFYHCNWLRDALKCQQCQKQFRSKAGLNYHSMSDHIKVSGGATTHSTLAFSKN
ncbi:hypothetical protein cypCar_00007514 [Cyprinus carpio]|nr:hypothetical protein cypCar_00007514 [Cyprinus carpio]